VPIPSTDVVGSTLRTALDGLSLRQRVTADNISNIDTPGFRAPTTGVSAAPSGPDGNNVDLQTETMTALRSVFQYQMLTRAVDDRYSLVTSAIGGI
jgi:flagellar basal-body rod protein FlgB